MRLLIAIMKEDEAGSVVDILMDREYRATRINTAGGFFKRGNSTLLIGFEDDQIDDVMNLINTTADTATVFVLNVLRHERL